MSVTSLVCITVTAVTVYIGNVVNSLSLKRYYDKTVDCVPQLILQLCPFCYHHFCGIQIWLHPILSYLTETYIAEVAFTQKTISTKYSHLIKGILFINLQWKIYVHLLYYFCTANLKFSQSVCQIQKKFFLQVFHQSTWETGSSSWSTFYGSVNVWNWVHNWEITYICVFLLWDNIADEYKI